MPTALLKTRRLGDELQTGVPRFRLVSTWGVALWIPRTAAAWIETMQFLMRMDAFGALKRLNQRGFL